MKDWKKVKLGEIAEIQTGFPFKGNQYENEGFLKTVRGENVTIGTLRWDTVKYWNNSTDGLEKYFLNKDDIVIGMDGSRVGQNRAIIRDIELPLILAQRVARLRAKSQATQKFIWYLIFSKNFQDYVEAIHTGTSIPHISQDQISNFEFLLPPLAIQERIAEILSSLDDKIDLLHRQNKTLEDLAQTLFRKCFIQDAKEEWETGKLGDEFNILMGQSPPGNSYNTEEEGIIFFQGRAEFGFRFPSVKYYCTEPSRIADKFDILISVRAPVGDINMALERCCIGRGLSSFRHKRNYQSYGLYRLKSLQDEFKLFEDNGTVFGSITKKDFEEITYPIPPNLVISDFDNIISGIDEKIYTNTLQLRTLTRLRDELLPKLMRGECLPE